MKHLIAAIALIPLLVPQADARCLVNCNRAVVVQDVIAIPAAVPVGIAAYAQPLAAAAPYQYSWTGQPTITVNVHLDKSTLTQAVREALTEQDQPLPQPPVGPLKTNAPPLHDAPLPQPPAGYEWKKVPVDAAKQATGEQPPLPPLPPEPTTNAMQRCITCHSAGSPRPKAFAKFNPLDPALSCEAKLRAVNDIATEHMPPPTDPLGGKLNGDEAGEIIAKMSRQANQ